MSKAAGLLGIKKTPYLLPDCHPLPIEFAGFDFSMEGRQIDIACTVKTIYKTGAEVEAMHGASIAALNMYDMLKPIDDKIEIKNIKLLKKTGGKSDLIIPSILRNAAIVVCSDSIAKGSGNDKAGGYAKKLLEQYGLAVQSEIIIPDDAKIIEATFLKFLQKKIDLIIFTGGTGVSPRDNTTDTLIPLLEKRLFGVEESMRHYGQQRTPVAMFSRSLAGTTKKSIVLALPGSLSGVNDAIQAVFPSILHLFDVLEGKRH